MRFGFLAVACVATMFGGPLIAVQPRPEIQLALGSLMRCDVQPRTVTVDVRLDSGGTITLNTIDRRSVAALPPAYRRLVPDTYDVMGPCPAAGERVRVTFCRNCQPTRINAVEVLGPNPLDERRQRLWVVRAFVDLAAPEASLDEYMSSMVIARYGRHVVSPRSLWLRGHLKRTMFTYQSTDRALAMFDKFGQARPELRASIEPGAQAYRQHGNRVGLIRAVPFVPEHPLGSPFVGSWGAFALEAYAEERTGDLLAIYPTPARQ
jgi:hypothetical protein